MIDENDEMVFCFNKRNQIIKIKGVLPTAGASYESPSKISGAEYAKLPQDVSSFCPGQNLLLNPKSVNLTTPNFSKNTTFSGFRSLSKKKKNYLEVLKFG